MEKTHADPSQAPYLKLRLLSQGINTHKQHTFIHWKSWSGFSRGGVEQAGCGQYMRSGGWYSRWCRTRSLHLLNLAPQSTHFWKLLFHNYAEIFITFLSINLWHHFWTYIRTKNILSCLQFAEFLFKWAVWSVPKFSFAIFSYIWCDCWLKQLAGLPNSLSRDADHRSRRVNGWIHLPASNAGMRARVKPSWAPFRLLRTETRDIKLLLLVFLDAMPIYNPIWLMVSVEKLWKLF